MHKNLLFSLLLFICYQSTAQLKIGGAVSANLSSWRREFQLVGESREGPNLHARLAIPVEFAFTPVLSIRLEPALTRRRLKIDFTGLNGENAKTWLVHQFIEFSALAQIRPVEAMRNLYFTGGGGVSWVQNSWAYFPKSTRESLGLSDARNENLVFENLREVLWLADAGVGYSLPLDANGSLFVESRFQYCLTDMLEGNFSSSRFSSFLISLGYQRAF